MCPGAHARERLRGCQAGAAGFVAEGLDEHGNGFAFIGLGFRKSLEAGDSQISMRALRCFVKQRERGLESAANVAEGLQGGDASPSPPVLAQFDKAGCRGFGSRADFSQRLNDVKAEVRVIEPRGKRGDRGEAAGPRSPRA